MQVFEDSRQFGVQTACLFYVSHPLRVASISYLVSLV